MSGMRGGGGGRVSGGDVEAQRAANATAPKIPDLFRRITGLFAPHRSTIALVVVLMVTGSLNMTTIVQVQEKGTFATMGLNFLSWNWLPLLPIFVDLMMDAPDHQWPMPHYPVV